MTDGSLTRGSGLFVAVVGFVMVVFFVTLGLAVGLSIFVDTTLTAESKTGELIRYGTTTSQTVEQLWRICSGAFGALSGLIIGKVW